MNVGQLRTFLQSFTNDCELHLEGGHRAKAVYRLVGGRGILVFIPDDDVLRISVSYDTVIGEDLED